MGFLIWLVVTVLTIIPLRALLPHFGIDRNWAFAAAIPFGALALIWWMAARLQELERK